MSQELRSKLESEIALLSAEDQQRVLRVIEALQSGAAIEPEFLRTKTPEQLRAFADALPEAPE